MVSIPCISDKALLVQRTRRGLLLLLLLILRPSSTISDASALEYAKNV